MFIEQNSHNRSIFGIFWPYLSFAVLVFIYNYIYLHYGFNATDEGYLLSLGSRIAEGEQPYSDFYFLRTPLSIYIQSIFISLFGDDYTVFVSRILWSIQMFIGTVILSFVYRKYCKPIGLFILLMISNVVMTQFVAFPWYNYDAIFFVIPAVYFLSRKYFWLTGISLFAASMAKQNFVLVLPLFLLIIGVLRYIKPGQKFYTRQEILRLSLGFIVAWLLYLVYLLISGVIDEFIQNVIVLPPQCSKISFWSAIFQNIQSAIIYAIPAILLIYLVYYSKSKRSYIVVLILWLATAFIIFYKTTFYIYSLAFINVTILIIAILVKNYATRRGRIKIIIPLAVFGLVVQYVSGISYSGIITSYTGIGVALPLIIILFYHYLTTGLQKVALYLLMGLILAGGIYYKTNYIYRDDYRSHLTAEFKTDKLKGIYSTPRNVDQIDGMVTKVEEITEPGDCILVYPDFPILYYLTDRKNSTPIEWFHIREFNSSMLPDVFEALEKNPPKLIFLQKYNEADYLREGSLYPFRNSQSRYTHLFQYITEYYRLQEMIGDVGVCVPKK